MTTTLSGKVGVLINDIWGNPTEGYTLLHKEEGLEGEVGKWQWRNWLQAYEFCKAQSEVK